MTATASVIVLGYNGRRYLEACLGALLDQDMPPGEYEILYVDNGSRDGSLALVQERFPGIRTLALDHNYGYAEGNNIGCRHTSGRFIVFLNQDTVPHRSWLRELVAALEEPPGAMAGHANIIQPWYAEFAGLPGREMVQAGYTAEVCRLGYIRYRRVENASQPLPTLFLHGVSIIIRRELLDHIGYAFDPDFFAYAEDLDLGLRVNAAGYRTVMAPRAVVYHLHTLDAGFSVAAARKTVLIIRNRLLAFYKCMTWPEFLVAGALVSIGSPLNVTEFGLRGARAWLYALALVPATAAAAVAALLNFPRLAERRREVLRTRQGGRFWGLRALWAPRPGAPVSSLR